MRVTVEADGGSRGNPGPAGAGAVVLDGDGTVLAERAQFLGVETNNVAEYHGLIAGLLAAREVGADAVDVRMDSKLVVEQMRGAWRVNNERLRELHEQARSVAADFDEVDYAWIPRARNTRADRLANQAMDAGAVPSEDSSTRPARTWAPPTGPATRLVLVRHGSTAHSGERRLSGRNDLALDPAGTAQAAGLAARAAQVPDVAAVVCSPLRRTRQTADWIASALRLDVVENEDFVELDFGDWEGLTIAEAAARDPEAVAAWLASPDVAVPGGESITELSARVARGRAAVVAAYSGRRVVVVTHVTPIKALVCDALGAPSSSMHRMFLDTASVSAIDYRTDGPASLRLFNDTGGAQAFTPVTDR